MRAALFDEVGRVLDDAAGGRPSALVATGSTGSGKSWLVDSASAMATERGMRVLATRGRPDDRELAFGALQSLLRPVERHLDELVPDHAETIRGALSFRDSTIDPLDLRVGVFRLLCAVSEAAPLCIVVDDADLIDRATADVLSFALGRLGADPIASILTSRGDATIGTAAVSATVVRLQPFADTEVVALLATRGVAAGPAAECARVAQGNPGMAIALAAGLTAGQRSGDARLPPLLRPEAAVLAQHQQALQHLDEHASRALVVVAADDMGEVRAVRSALALLGEPVGPLDDAEQQGLIEIDGPQVRFVDPWLRPAAYYLVAPASRRAAHRALAESYSAPQQAASRAWHLAAAADGPSDSVAEALAMVAADALRRGGVTSAAQTLLRAADFAESSLLREQLQLRALEQWVDAHDLDAAGALATRIEVSTDDGAIALVEVATIRGSGAALPGVSSLDQSGTWARRRATRLRREELARCGRHAELDALDVEGFAAHAHLCLAIGHRHAGRLTEARESLAVVEALTTPSCHLLHRATALVHADLDLLLGRIDDARQRLAAAAAEPSDDAWLRRDERWLHERMACATAETPSSPWTSGASVDVADGTLAEIRSAIASGIAGRNTAAIEAAITRAEAARLPIEVAEATVAIAELLRVMHDPNADDAARTALSALWAVRVRCWDQRVSVSAAASARPDAAAPRIVDAGIAQLSQAEMRVAEAVASGMTNREAAASLFLSVKTIDFHLQQIYRKLGVRSRTELAVRVAGQDRGAVS